MLPLANSSQSTTNPLTDVADLTAKYEGQLDLPEISIPPVSNMPYIGDLIYLPVEPFPYPDWFKELGKRW